MSAAAQPLWDFAVAVYAQPGIDEACLALQDRLGADVNMLLFCLWAVPRMDDGGFARILPDALKISRDWQQSLVTPLRLCRRGLKAYAARSTVSATDRLDILALREQVKASELEAERLQLAALETLVTGRGVAGAVTQKAAARRVAGYFYAAALSLDPLGETQVLRIVEAAFGESA